MKNIFSLLLYRPGHNFISDVTSESIANVIGDWYNAIDNIYNFIQEEPEEFKDMLIDDSIFDKKSINEMIKFVENNDLDTFKTKLYTDHKLELVINLFEDHLDYFGDLAESTVIGNILVTNNLVYIKMLQDYGIVLEPLVDDYYIINLSIHEILGSGAFGIAIYSDDKVVKLSIDEDEYNKSIFLKILKGSGETNLSKHFVDIYDTKEIEESKDMQFFVIIKEFIECDGSHDAEGELIDITKTETYKNFEELLMKIGSYAGSRSYWDIHDDNAMINIKNKDVEFMYYDY